MIGTNKYIFPGHNTYVCVGRCLRMCAPMLMYVWAYTLLTCGLTLTYTENGCYFSRLVTKYVV
ncbi:hypothetical protein, partial [Phocaeicola sartorii]|uniref:hypothetical protein n=1 Tax=Phocaeicola sartorii TaxID=671267 RepID=UPI001C87502F